MSVTRFTDLTGTVFAVAIQISRQLTASESGIAGFQVPFDAQLIELSGYARSCGGTDPSLTLAIKRGFTTLGTIAVRAGAVSVSKISQEVLDGDDLIVDAIVGGTGASWDDITLVLTFRRTN